jgi:hypothetical protein
MAGDCRPAESQSPTPCRSFAGLPKLRQQKTSFAGPPKLRWPAEASAGKNKLRRLAEASLARRSSGSRK